MTSKDIMNEIETSISTKKKYTHLTILKYIGRGNKGEPLVEVLCDCGKTSIKSFWKISYGKLKSCSRNCQKPYRAIEKVKSQIEVDIQSKTKYGNLTILKYIDSYVSSGKRYYSVEVKCDCGRTKVINDYHAIVLGRRKSCGCKGGNQEYGLSLIEENIKKETKYGKLKIISYIGSKHQSHFVNTKCDCGNIYATRFRNLYRGITTSCGCDNIHNSHSAVGTKTSILLSIENDIHKQTKYGNLIIIEYQGYFNKKYRVKCLCECGNIKENINYYQLVCGNTTSCGDCVYQNILNDIQNKTKYGKLVIIKDEGLINTHRYVSCLCECGNITNKIRYNTLKNGESTSCGCGCKSSSNAEQNLAKLLVEYYGEHRVKSSITQNMKQLELSYFNETFNEQRKFLYDIVIDDKYIIEYNGIAFHPKSKDDKSWKHPFKNIDVKTAWEHDQLKKQVATNNGYFILEVWEDENIEESVRKIISFVSNNPQ